MNFSTFAKAYTWMSDHALWREALPDIARHLPPSAAGLRLLDVGCGAGVTLRNLYALRPELLGLGLDAAPGMLQLARKGQQPGHYLQGDAYHLPFSDNSFDAVLSQRVFYLLPDKPAFLRELLRVLRPGGRVLLLDPLAGPAPWAAWREWRHGKAALDLFAWHMAGRALGRLSLEDGAAFLQAAGFARILTEPTLKGWALLSRGEKPHPPGSATPERIAVAATEANSAAPVQSSAVQGLPGRYLHLLIAQTPDKPPWALGAGEKLEWRAAAVMRGGQLTVLAFSGLPKAVALMQGVVMEGLIPGINKVGKFSKASAAAWKLPLWLNPSLDDLRPHLPPAWLPLDPASAEASDE